MPSSIESKAAPCPAINPMDHFPSRTFASTTGASVFPSTANRSYSFPSTSPPNKRISNSATSPKSSSPPPSPFPLPISTTPPTASPFRIFAEISTSVSAKTPQANAPIISSPPFLQIALAAMGSPPKNSPSPSPSVRKVSLVVPTRASVADLSMAAFPFSLNPISLGPLGPPLQEWKAKWSPMPSHPPPSA